MLFTVSVIAACSVFTIFSIVHRLSGTLLKLIFGYNAISDILYMALFTAAAVASGSLMGMVISVVTGLFVTITLILGRRYYGGAKLCFSMKGIKVKTLEPTHSLPF